MRYRFQPLPNDRRPYPVIPFSFERLPRIRLFGLVDSGARTTRIDGEWADELGIDLSDVEATPFSVAGDNLFARKAAVTLMLDRYRLETEVTFVDGWRHSHQLLGLDGFFDRFIVRIDAADGELKLSPRPRRTS